MSQIFTQNKADTLNFRPPFPSCSLASGKGRSAQALSSPRLEAGGWWIQTEAPFCTCPGFTLSSQLPILPVPQTSLLPLTQQTPSSPVPRMSLNLGPSPPVLAHMAHQGLGHSPSSALGLSKFFLLLGAPTLSPNSLTAAPHIPTHSPLISPSDPLPKPPKERLLPLWAFPTPVLPIVIKPQAGKAGRVTRVSVMCRSRPAALESLRSLLEMQSRRLHLKPTESESAL